MISYLLDTNIVLRFCNPGDRQHQISVRAVSRLLDSENDCYLTAQVLIEFWVVATRPTHVNGLGWSAEQTYHLMQQLCDRFLLIEESAQVFPIWLTLVREYQVVGKRTHDIRLAAVMIANHISHVLTFNTVDFSGIKEIQSVHPEEIGDRSWEI